MGSVYGSSSASFARLRELAADVQWLALEAQVREGLVAYREIEVPRPRALGVCLGIREAELAERAQGPGVGVGALRHARDDATDAEGAARRPVDLDRPVSRRAPVRCERTCGFESRLGAEVPLGEGAAWTLRSAA